MREGRDGDHEYESWLTEQQQRQFEHDGEQRVRRWIRRKRREDFDEKISASEADFFQQVSHAKPYADFFGLLTTHAVIVGLFFALGERMSKNGWSDRSALAMFALFVIWINFIGPYNRVIDRFSDVVVLKAIRRLSIKNPLDSEWLTVRLLWTGTSTLLGMLLAWGLAFVAYDATSRIIDYAKAPTVVHRQVSPP